MVVTSTFAVEVKSQFTLGNFFLSFTTIACQIVEYDPSEILGKGQGRLCNINSILWQTVWYTAKGLVTKLIELADRLAI